MTQWKPDPRVYRNNWHPTACQLYDALKSHDETLAQDAARMLTDVLVPHLAPDGDTAETRHALGLLRDRLLSLECVEAARIVPVDADPDDWDGSTLALMYAELFEPAGTSGGDV